MRVLGLKGLKITPFKKNQTLIFISEGQQIMGRGERTASPLPLCMRGLKNK